MGEPKKTGFKSAFKFSLSTASLKPSPNPKSEQSTSASSILRPRKGLNELDSKSRWSQGLSPLRSNQSGSESQLNNIGRYETSSGMRYSIQPIIGTPLRENGIMHSGDENRGPRRTIYDRPRSQVYPASPLKLSEPPQYDIPKKTEPVQEQLKVNSLDIVNHNSTNSNEPIRSTKDLNENYQTKSTKGTLDEDKGQVKSVSRPLSERVPEGGQNDTVSPTSPIPPPRRSSSSSNTLSKSSSFSPGCDQLIQKSPKAPQRRRRLTRQISLEPKKLEDDEFIGFATLPDQVHRKAVKRGFEFCLMVVGETGLGKSTLINSLFLTDLYKERRIPSSQDSVEQTVDIEKKQLEIEERGVKVRLSVVDTPGFNDALNGDENWKPIIDYVDRQFEQFYQAESGVNRKNIQDTRVHCCLYFISPYGHGLKPLDIFMMKKLHHKVNIIPLIAKSDILTPKEVKQLKTKILDEIEKHQIDIYQFPECDSDEDEEFKQQDKALKSAIPFAVVGSNTVVEVAGKKIRGRMYPWGIVEVDNPKHCDFGKLRQMLISTHMQDLKDITADTHYENYRAEHLAEQMGKSHRERTKLKRDSIANIDSLQDTDNLIAQKDAEIQRMQAMLAKMQAQLQTNPRTAVNGT